MGALGRTDARLDEGRPTSLPSKEREGRFTTVCRLVSLLGVNVGCLSAVQHAVASSPSRRHQSTAPHPFLSACCCCCSPAPHLVRIHWSLASQPHPLSRMPRITERAPRAQRKMHAWPQVSIITEMWRSTSTAMSSLMTHLTIAVVKAPCTIRLLHSIKPALSR